MALPAGIMVDYGGAVAPSGWILCDGSAVSRTTYAGLFAVLGTAFGVGDGSTTFNLPDARGRFVVGAGQGAGLTNRALAATGGEESHTLTTAEIPAHNHPVTDPGHHHGAPNSRNYVEDGTGTAYATGATAAGTVTAVTSDAVTGLTVGNAGGGGAHNTMPPYIGMSAIICTGL